jgi:hypothetical protein
MALGGGSVAVSDATETALSGAVPGVIRCKTLTFRNMAGNTGAIAIGVTGVELDGVPSIVKLAAGESFTLNAPGSGDGSSRDARLSVDFTKLFAIAEVDEEVLQVIYAD